MSRFLTETHLTRLLLRCAAELCWVHKPVGKTLSQRSACIMNKVVLTRNSIFRQTQWRY